MHNINSISSPSASASSCGRADRGGSESKESAMLRGERPEFNNMVRHCGASANKQNDAEESGAGGSRCGQNKRRAGRGEAEESGARGAGSTGGADEQKLRDLLRTILQDGTINPQEIAQLRQAVGSGSTPGTGCTPGTGGRPGTETPPVTGGGTPGVGGTPTPVAGGTSGLGADGSITLGNTKVSVQGGTAEERAGTADLIQQMYAKDPGFKQGIDSKARSGLEITIENLAPGIAGRATLGGNEISLDSGGFGRSEREFADTIAHELAHNLGQRHGPALEAFAAQAAAVVA